MKYAIVDDNSFLIKATMNKMALCSECELYFTAIHGEDCLQQLENKPHTDLILMDIEMPVLDGIETTRRVKNLYPHIKIIMLTVFDNDAKILSAIQAGADGYLLKDAAPSNLNELVLSTMSGGAALTPSVALKALKLLRNPALQISDDDDTDFELSEREIQVLQQLGSGLTYTAIARNLFLSPGTIRKHTENIYKKLQVHSKVEAVKKAKDHRLI